MVYKLIIALSHTRDRAVKMIDSRLSGDTPRHVTGQLPDEDYVIWSQR